MKCPMKGMTHGGEGHSVAKMATGVMAASAGKHASKGIMSKLSRHPLVLISLGAVAGYMIHKYRKQIVSGATDIGDKSKDFVMQQKENLEDIVAEVKQSDEDSSTS